MKFVELFDKLNKKCKRQTDFSLHFLLFLTPKIAPSTPRIKILRSAFGARRPEQESFTSWRSYVRWLNGSEIKFVVGEVKSRKQQNNAQ